MKPLPKEYNHKEREKYWQEQWGASDLYHFKDDKPREETFVIDTPPPTVSGVLHMGHIFSYTQADFVARYQRMIGKDVCYPMGFDDNGLPTERLVEQIKKVRGGSMPRAEFVALCREVVKDAEEEFRRLFRSAALSVDWRREYRTISDEVRALSQASFLDMLKKGEAYRKLQPMLWDPVDQTAIAQAEIVDKEMPSQMNDIIFFIDGEMPRKEIMIATTRPELLGACVAVFYHPDDTRYGYLKGKTAVTPLFGVKVPILADESVKMDKGTGLVMCCTFGDETDIHWWEAHKLPTRVILDKYGKIRNLETIGSPDWPSVQDPERLKLYSEKLNGLKTSAAREAMFKLLKEHDLLVKQTPITHAVKCAERSGAALEILPTPQWFVKVLDKKEALKTKANECNWFPDYMRIRIEQWIDGLNWDWCISRQRFFGVPFPVWYVRRQGSNDEWQAVVPKPSELPIDPFFSMPKGLKHKMPGLSFEQVGKVAAIAVENITDLNGKVLFEANPNTVLEVMADYDVMDTWATSSISPQINARTLAPCKLFPADLRPQAHEIIRTWAFYTIVKAYLHANTIPWKNLMISGWCLAADKTKMSKSKGNVVTPVALIEEKGTDAVRYWASTSRLGADTAFSEDLLKIGRKLVTKLWNASNFAALNLSHLEKIPPTPIRDKTVTETLDKWILSRLHQCIRKATLEFNRFEYCEARVAIEDFFWNDFCDNYLELAKARAYEKNASALHTLYHCLEALLRLFAPFVPHVTEEIYSHLFEHKGSVHARGQWPCADDYPYDAKAEHCGMAAVDLLNVVRKAKSEANVSIKFPVERVEAFARDGAPAWNDFESVLADLKSTAGAEAVVQAPGEGASLSQLSEKGWFAASVKLAAQAQAG